MIFVLAVLYVCYITHSICFPSIMYAGIVVLDLPAQHPGAVVALPSPSGPGLPARHPGAVVAFPNPDY